MCGTYCHAIIKQNPKVKPTKEQVSPITIPWLVPLSGRVEEALNTVLEKVFYGLCQTPFNNCTPKIRPILAIVPQGSVLSVLQQDSVLGLTHINIFINLFVFI